MPAKHGLTSAFTDYIKFLPLELLPTFWTAAERSLLTGTTLAPAVTSKLNSLYREYDNVRASTSNIAWCAESWWHDVDGHVGFDDWLQVDAMYRSRALEFPGIGDCMAPCIDMANHVDGDLTAAVYEVDAEGNAVLLLRDGKTVEEGDEVSITYGDAKGACEMVFSYGFLDHDMTSAKELFLDLSFPLDDPLRKAKTLVADTAPGFKVVQTENGISWEGDYVWLVCVNEEDGLEFAIEQTLDGGTELKSFWKQQDLPELGNFKTLLTKDEQWELFHLRAICVLQDRVATQLQTLYRVEDEVNAAEHGEGTAIRERPWQLAMRLRTLEGELLEQAYSHFEDLVSSSTSSLLAEARLLIRHEQKVHLAQSDVVQRFLTATENEVVAQPFEADLGTNIDARVEEDDFS